MYDICTRCQDSQGIHTLVFKKSQKGKEIKRTILRKNRGTLNYSLYSFKAGEKAR